MSDILVVDRDQILLPHILSWDYTVEDADSIELAVEMLRLAHFRAVILAVCGDAPDGVDAIKRIYEVSPDIRVVAIGAQSSLALERQVRLAKVFFYTVRPVDLEELKAVLQRALGDCS